MISLPPKSLHHFITPYGKKLSLPLTMRLKKNSLPDEWIQRLIPLEKRISQSSPRDSCDVGFFFVCVKFNMEFTRQGVNFQEKITPWRVNSTSHFKGKSVSQESLIVFTLYWPEFLIKLEEKNFLHSSDIDIVAKCGVNNQLTEILKRKEDFKTSDTKNMIQKKKIKNKKKHHCFTFIKKLF